MVSPSRSGAFGSEVDRRVESFTESISFDARLYRQDIEGSIAHAQMLADQGMITEHENQQIAESLQAIGTEIEGGTFEFQTQYEDVHMNIEHALIERLGDVGRKLHTGRSRNDQVSTDLRLWVRKSTSELDQRLVDLQWSFLTFAEREATTIIPAYTHLQRAQPVLAAHYFLAFVEKWQRDRDRLSDCLKRCNQSALGTAALAGTSLPIDRQATSQSLGFTRPIANSLDSSSDRDFVLEFTFCLSLIAIHLSNWAEDWIIWSTCEFDFIELPEAFCTGSSIMPQKINPDVLELIRGKSARVIGDLQTLLVLVKGLPMAYNRDLQEDKPALFDAFDTVRDSLELAAPLVGGSKLKADSISDGIERGYLDATTLMEFLIKRGTPQRRAHYMIGQLVRHAMSVGKPLADLSLAEFQSIDAELDDSVYDVLGVARAVEAFESEGSTAPAKVAEQVQYWKQVLSPSSSS